MFCKHNFVESSNKSGCIFCTMCGKIKLIPCNHTFEVVNQREIIRTSSDIIKGIFFTSRCSKCGKIITDNCVVV